MLFSMYSFTIFLFSYKPIVNEKLGISFKISFTQKIPMKASWIFSFPFLESVGFFSHK